MRATDGEIVAFSDANATWAPDALRKLVRTFADPESPTSAAGCGSSTPTVEREGVYWRYEMARARPSRGSARSPAATARSTPCAARTTSRSTRASVTTCRCRT